MARTSSDRRPPRFRCDKGRKGRIAYVHLSKICVADLRYKLGQEMAVALLVPYQLSQ